MTWVRDAGAAIAGWPLAALVVVLVLATLLLLAYAAGVRRGRLLQGRDFVSEACGRAVAERIGELVPAQRGSRD